MRPLNLPPKHHRQFQLYDPAKKNRLSDIENKSIDKA